MGRGKIIKLGGALIVCLCALSGCRRPLGPGAPPSGLELVCTDVEVSLGGSCLAINVGENGLEGVVGQVQAGC